MHVRGTAKGDMAKGRNAQRTRQNYCPCRRRKGQRKGPCPGEIILSRLTFPILKAAKCSPRQGAPLMFLPAQHSLLLFWVVQACRELTLCDKAHASVTAANPTNSIGFMFRHFRPAGETPAIQFRHFAGNIAEECSRCLSLTCDSLATAFATCTLYTIVPAGWIRRDRVCCRSYYRNSLPQY